MATIDNYTIDIKVTGDQDLKNATNDVNNLGKSVDSLANGNLNNLGQKLQDSGSAAENAAEKMNVLKEKSEALVTAIAGIGAIEFVKNLLESADATVKLSNAFGLTVSSTLELQAAMAKIGVDGQSAAKAMETLSLSAQKVSEGDAAATDSFAKLGISFKDLQTLDMPSVFKRIAEQMAENKGNTDMLAAAHTLLGRAFIGKDFEEFATALKEVAGTQEGAAKTTQSLAETQQRLEQSTLKIKTAFLELIAPVAEFISTFVVGGENAKLVADALAAAMVALGASFAIKGIVAVKDAIVGLVTWMGSLFGVTVAESAAVTANSTAQAANTAVRVAGIQMKIAELEVTKTLIAAKMAEIDAMIAENIFVKIVSESTTEYVRAKEAQATIEAASVAVTAAATKASEALAAAQAATATTATTAAVSTTTFTAVLARFAVGAAVVAGILATLWPSSLNDGEDEFLRKNQELTSALKMMTDDQLDNYKKLNQAEKDHLRDKIIAAAETKRLAIETAKVTGGEMPGPGLDLGGNKTLIAANDKPTDFAAQQKVIAAQQTQALIDQNNQMIKRLQLQEQMIGLSNEEKVTLQANFDVETRRTQEITKLQNELELKEATRKKGGEAANAGLDAEIAGLRQRLAIFQNMTDKSAEYLVKIERTKEAEQERLRIQNLQLSIDTDVYKEKVKLYELDLTSNEKIRAGLRQQIDLIGMAQVKDKERILGRSLNAEEEQQILKDVRERAQVLVETTDLEIQKSRDFSTAWNQAWKQYGEDSKNGAKQASDAFRAVTDTMNSSIDNFVKTGKFSFHDFAISVIQDLLAIELKALASQVLTSIFGRGGMIASLFGFAEGGDTTANTPIIVGEKGPEVFIPKTAGSIVPNNKLATTGSGMAGESSPQHVVNNYNTYNINALDSKSVAQVFAENRKSMLGAMTMAQKEMPYSMAGA